jgi:hypothetical protein
MLSRARCHAYGEDFSEGNRVQPFRTRPLQCLTTIRKPEKHFSPPVLPAALVFASSRQVFGTRAEHPLSSEADCMRNTFNLQGFC